jgi:hypothetical protein
VNLEDELRSLEEAAKEKFGAYEEQVNTKVRKCSFSPLYLFFAD